MPAKTPTIDPSFGDPLRSINARAGAGAGSMDSSVFIEDIDWTLLQFDDIDDTDTYTSPWGTSAAGPVSNLRVKTWQWYPTTTSGVVQVNCNTATGVFTFAVAAANNQTGFLRVGLR